MPRANAHEITPEIIDRVFMELSSATSTSVALSPYPRQPSEYAAEIMAVMRSGRRNRERLAIVAQLAILGMVSIDAGVSR